MIPPLHFLDPPTPLKPAHPGRQRLLDALTDSPLPQTHLWAAAWGPGKWGGVFVQPATDVLGLRPWEDAWEGVTGEKSQPWAIFELEKIMRMLLAGSGLAFEILASPDIAIFQGLERSFGRTLITCLLQNRIFDHYLALCPKTWEEASSPEAINRLRSALTGGLLAKDGAISTTWEHLIEAFRPSWSMPLSQWAAGDTLDPGVGDEILGALYEAMTLGQKTWSSKPTGYDEANRILITLRQHTLATPSPTP